MSHLVVDNVVKQYPTRSDPLVVLRGVSFDLSAGESMAVLGPSGSGKSTLLHVIGTLESPTSGTVRMDGQNPYQLDEPQLAAFRNQSIGLVFQDHHLLPQLTVLENVLVPAVAAGATNEADAHRARQLLQRVGLSERLDHRPAELSGGERQRVALARALVLNPKLVLADEPTGNLDRTNAKSVGELLLDLVAAGEHAAMLIVVTHSQELANLFQERYLLDDGKLVETL